jgi:hypothetical protein
MAYLRCLWWSDYFPVKFLVLICLTRFLNLLELFFSSSALLFREEARDVYRWDISLNIQSAPSPSCANFLTSFLHVMHFEESLIPIPLA